MATIKNIAEKLGIAVSTVSKGLNGASDISEEMRQLVLDTAVEMGYASKKKQKLEKRSVCVLVENMEYENIGQFGYEVIVGFKLSAAQRQCNVAVIPSSLDLQTTEKFDTYMLKNSYCGAFLLGFTLQDDYIQQLSKTTVPTVLLDNHIPNNQLVGCVGTDNFEGIDLAVEHLAALGHQKIAFLNGYKNSMVAAERKEAFFKSIKKHSVPICTELVANGYYVANSAKYFVNIFLEQGATAILCASDLIASGVVAELHRCGKRIPEDISIVGFDDLPVAQRLIPALTTVRQDRVSIGKSAFMQLEELISGVGIGRLLLRPELMVRASTAPCPADS